MAIQENATGFVVFRLGTEFVEVLLLDDGNFWTFPKGKPKKREEPFETAIRELKEETSLDLIISSTKFVSAMDYTFEREEVEVAKHVDYFAGVTDRSDVILSEEHYEFKWVHYRNAYRMLKTPEYRKVLADAWNWLKDNNASAEFLARNLIKLR